MEPTPQAAPERALPERGRIEIATRFAQVGRGYWLGPEAAAAWALTAGVFALVLVGIAVNVGINSWNGQFFNALERRDWAGFSASLQGIVALALAMAVAGAAYVQVKMRLQVCWRRWLTSQLVDRWLDDRRYYRLSIANGSGISNPEYRIADDVRNATEPLVDFVAAIVTSILMAITFIGVLYKIGGAATFSVAGLDVTVPGFMVLSVLVYSAITTALMMKVGRPLVANIETRNASEAEFRYSLTRIRENAEPIALSGADRVERANLMEGYRELVARWIEVIRREARMTALTNGNNTLTPVIPLLLCAPKYLQGQMTLGDLVQVGSAFLLVHQSLNWLADNAIRIAEWLASAQRVVAIADTLDRLDTGDALKEQIVIADSDDGAFHLEQLSINEPGGRLIISGGELVIPAGQDVLVRGRSGSGKSTLVRAMAGLWPWGSGTIRRPKDARIEFLLQRPMVSSGSLRATLLNGTDPATVTDERLRSLMTRCGLSHLKNRLDQEESWSLALQGGELQRLAFVRLLVAPPDIVIMDEATSALDNESEAALMQLLRNELAAVTVICVGRRADLEPFFERHLRLEHDPIRRVTVLSDVSLDSGEPASRETTSSG